VTIDLTHTRYKVLKEAAADIGWKIIDDEKKKIKVKLNIHQTNEPATVEDLYEKKDKATERIPAKKMCDLFWNDVRIDDARLSSMKIY